MSPSHVLEPTYERLKRELLSCRWPQDTRLEAWRIAEDYGVSATPVRDCLNRLTGEGLVTMRPGEGYRVPRLTERGVRDMLVLHRLLVTSAIELNASTLSDESISADNAGYAEAVTALFTGLAETSENSAIVQTVRALGERLHPVRMMEPDVFGDTDEELSHLRKSSRRRPADLAAAIISYHDRRIGQAPALIAALP